MTHDQICFIDSLYFFQMLLSAFPKTFAIKELKKGYFLHLFDTPVNQEYEGPIPDKHYYMPETMSVSGRKDFETWHDQQVADQVHFDFSKERIEYCKSVKLLKAGYFNFKRLFEKESKSNPFDRITIASACNRNLRQNRMTPNTIASEPLHGWCMCPNHSKVSLERLHWQDSQLSEPSIQHAGNTGQYRIPNAHYTVDGYDPDTNTVYKFQGCFWDQCSACYPNHTEAHSRLEDCCADDVYHCTQNKLLFLKNKGYNVEEIWESRWGQMKKEHNDIRVCRLAQHYGTSRPS